MSQFKIRKTCPGKGNKCYIRKVSGGWSDCIKGKPTNKNCDVLANCVGYAIGRASEIYNEIKGTEGNYFNNLNTDAERIYALAKKKGYKVGKTPKPGAMIVWKKGKANDGSDGAGHVAIVEKVVDNNTIYLSESGYGSAYFWNSTRKNTNKNWGQNTSYTFLGFVYNPAVTDTPTPEPTDKLKVGDKVEIIGVGNSKSDGTGATAYGIGYIRYINSIVKGAKYPYDVGNKKKVRTGYYKESALKKVK